MLAVERIREEAGWIERGVVDVFKWTFLTSDVVAHVVFGDSFHMLESERVSLSRAHWVDHRKHPIFQFISLSVAQAKNDMSNRKTSTSASSNGC
jgi:hypothetical protein